MIEGNMQYRKGTKVCSENINKYSLKSKVLEILVSVYRRCYGIYVLDSRYFTDGLCVEEAGYTRAEGPRFSTRRHPRMVKNMRSSPVNPS
jgi:hypothetical protein